MAFRVMYDSCLSNAHLRQQSALTNMLVSVAEKMQRRLPDPRGWRSLRVVSPQKRPNRSPSVLWDTPGCVGIHFIVRRPLRLRVLGLQRVPICQAGIASNIERQAGSGKDAQLEDIVKGVCLGVLQHDGRGESGAL